MFVDAECTNRNENCCIPFNTVYEKENFRQMSYQTQELIYIVQVEKKENRITSFLKIIGKTFFIPVYYRPGNSLR